MQNKYIFVLKLQIVYSSMTNLTNMQNDASFVNNNKSLLKRSNSDVLGTNNKLRKLNFSMCKSSNILNSISSEKIQPNNNQVEYHTIQQKYTNFPRDLDISSTKTNKETFNFVQSDIENNISKKNKNIETLVNYNATNNIKISAEKIEFLFQDSIRSEIFKKQINIEKLFDKNKVCEKKSQLIINTCQFNIEVCKNNDFYPKLCRSIVVFLIDYPILPIFNINYSLVYYEIYNFARYFLQLEPFKNEVSISLYNSIYIYYFLLAPLTKIVNSIFVDEEKNSNYDIFESLFMSIYEIKKLCFIFENIDQNYMKKGLNDLCFSELVTFFSNSEIINKFPEIYTNLNNDHNLDKSEWRKQFDLISTSILIKIQKTKKTMKSCRKFYNNIYTMGSEKYLSNIIIYYFLNHNNVSNQKNILEFYLGYNLNMKTKENIDICLIDLLILIYELCLYKKQLMTLNLELKKIMKLAELIADKLEKDVNINIENEKSIRYQHDSHYLIFMKVIYYIKNSQLFLEMNFKRYFRWKKNFNK